MSEQETAFETMQATTDYTGGTVSPIQIDPRLQTAFGQVYGSVFGSGSGVRSVVVTSATEGEGVTTTAAGLALIGADAQPDATIAVVDLNFRDPALHERLRVPQQPGISDAISGRSHITGCAHRAGFENLFVFPVGSERVSAVGLLRSGAFQQLFGDLLANFEHVIFDCPPVLSYPEAQMLASQVDGVLLVCETNATRREKIADAKKRIELGHGNVLGVVLNKHKNVVPGFLDRRI